MAADKFSRARVILVLLFLHKTHRHIGKLPHGLWIVASNAPSNEQEHVVRFVEVLFLKFAVVTTHELHPPVESFDEVAAVRFRRYD